MRRMLTVFAVGLSGALVAAVVVVAVPAEGAPSGGGPGDPLLLSRVNQAGPMTVLKTNGGLRILAKNPVRPPLMVYTPDSMAPFDVSSTARVDNLNADLLDGLDSSAFSPAVHAHDDRYFTEAEADARFLGSTATAANAELLDGLDSDAFVRGDDLLVAGIGVEGAFTVTTTDTVVKSVSLTPPADGTVLLVSSATAVESFPGDGVACTITTGTALDTTFVQAWMGGGLDASLGSLAGTRGFSVDGGVPFTANLVCRHSGASGSTNVDGASLMAIFIPYP